LSFVQYGEILLVSILTKNIAGGSDYNVLSREVITVGSLLFKADRLIAPAVMYVSKRTKYFKEQL